jgi:hypothetical protein
MPNRNLTPDELKNANDLLAEIRDRLIMLAGDDPLLLFAYRRKVMKELSYDERSKPGVRAKLKAMKWGRLPVEDQNRPPGRKASRAAGHRPRPRFQRRAVRA